MKAISTGNTYRIYDDSLETYDVLPPQVYSVRFSNMTGFFLEKHADMEISERKIYGVHLGKVEKVFASFETFERNLGVILSGDKPFTRDTFSSCIKATYCEIDDKPFPIFKNPKDGGFKKSQKGCCVVTRSSDNKLVYVDERTWDEAQVSGEDAKENLLQPIFKNGVMVNEQSLFDIRNILHGGEF